MAPTDDNSSHRPRRALHYRPQRDLAEPPHKVSEKGNLRTFDVFSLIVNKMVGTGIYTTPATVFLMTGQKALTLGLFAVGFMYSVVSMAIYLDFAKVLPFNGGELIYLNEITSVVSVSVLDSTTPSPAVDNTNGTPLSNLDHGGRESRSTSNAETRSAKQNKFSARVKERATRISLLLGDGLWAFITYSIAFIVFFNSGSNSLQFGRMILLCVDDKDNTDSTSSGDKNQEQDKISNGINQDVMRLIGVNVLTLICLLQYFSPGFGRGMNKTLAVIKLGSLFVLMIVAGTAKSASDDWRVWHPTEAEQESNSNIGKPANLAFAKALLAVLFSFEGWENATFVAGEIPAKKHYILRRGFIAAVLTVGIFYLIIVVLFLRAITWKDISDGHENANYPPMFTGGGIQARQAWAIMAAISSFGSLNAIIYTFSRVKQVIGQAEILPWSRYLKKDDILQRVPSKADEDQDERVGDAQAEEGQAGYGRPGDEVLNEGMQGVNDDPQRAQSDRAEDESSNGDHVSRRARSERTEDESPNEASREPDDESSVTHNQRPQYECQSEAPQADNEVSPLVQSDSSERAREDSWYTAPEADDEVSPLVQSDSSERAREDSRHKAPQADDEVPPLDQSDSSEPAKEDFWHKAPQGGLIVHWIMSVIVISASAAFPTTLEAAGLPGYIQTYVHCFFQGPRPTQPSFGAITYKLLGILGIGFYHLKSRDRALWDPRTSISNWFKKLVRLFLHITVPFYILLNAVILVINAVGPYKGTDGSSVAFPGYAFPIIVGALLAISTAYYVVFFGASSRLYESIVNTDNGTVSSSSTTTVTHTENGILDREIWLNFMKWANVQCEIRKNYAYDDRLERVYRFGRRWRMVYYVPEDKGYESLSQTPGGVTPGQASNRRTSDNIPDGVTVPMFLYWLFGGSRLKPDWNPGDITAQRWNKFKANFHSKANEWKTTIGHFFNCFNTTKAGNDPKSGRRPRLG